MRLLRRIDVGQHSGFPLGARLALQVGLAGPNDAPNRLSGLGVIVDLLPLDNGAVPCTDTCVFIVSSPSCMWGHLAAPGRHCDQITDVPTHRAPSRLDSPEHLTGPLVDWGE